jgi:PTH1 family peptidyl-tRNA hydrolase
VGLPAKPKLVVGLGNPGPDYAGSRHNIGFEVVDELAKQWGCSLRRKLRVFADVGTAAGVTLAKPRTFMNRSGTAVAALLQWLKLSPQQLLVIVDDADLPLGQIRLRASGGSGGHNGLRSIIEALGGNEQFPRLRVGIGRRGRPGEDITDHVLSRFEPAERDTAARAVATAAEAVRCCVTEGLTEAMNRFNRKTPVQEGEQH